MAVFKAWAAAAGAVVALMSFAQPATAASITRQGGCSTGSTCLTITPTSTIPIIRQLGFNAPTAGTALAVFNGTLYCAASGTPIQDRVVDLVAQIVGSSNAVVDANGPGGMRIATVLKDEPDHLFDTSMTFNMSASKAFPVEAGANKVFFKMQRLRMDTNTSCIVYSATFSVITTP